MIKSPFLAVPALIAMACVPCLAVAGPRTGQGSPMRIGASTLREAQTYLDLSLEPGTVQVKEQLLVCGNLRLALDSGTVTRVVAGGKVVGLYFQGKGRMAYLSRNPDEAAALRYNLDRNAGLQPVKTPEGLQVEDGLREALVFLEGKALPAFAGEPAKTPQDAFGTLVDWFDADSLPYAGHGAALQAGNAPGRCAALGLLRGKAGRYVFQRDEVSERKESLSLVQWREIPGVPFLKVIPLSSLWLEGSFRRPPAPTFSVTMVDLDIKVKEKAGGTVVAVETVVPQREGLQVLDFRLHSSLVSHPNSVAFEKIPLNLLAVEAEDGTPLAFDHRMNRLVVKFPKPLAAGVPVKVTFRIQGEFLREHVSDQYVDLGGDAWFPLANQVGQAFKAHCRLEVPRPFTGILPGRILRQEETATHSILETAVDVPVARLAFSAGPYVEEVFRDPRTKVALHVHGYAFPPSKAKTLQQARTIHGIIAHYESLLGPFPFQDLHIMPFLGGNAGGTLPGLLTFSPTAGSYWMDNESAASALAAQYWGVQVRGCGLDEAPLRAALTSIMTVNTLRLMPGRGDRAADGRDNYWSTFLPQVLDASSISHAEWLVPSNRDHREAGFGGAILMGKGLRLMERIQREVGNPAFAAFLATLQRDYAWKPLVAEDLPQVLGSLTGKDWMPVFEQYYWSNGPVD